MFYRFIVLRILIVLKSAVIVFRSRYNLSLVGVCGGGKLEVFNCSGKSPDYTRWGIGVKVITSTPWLSVHQVQPSPLESNPSLPSMLPNDPFLL